MDAKFVVHDYTTNLPDLVRFRTVPVFLDVDQVPDAGLSKQVVAAADVLNEAEVQQ